MAVILSRKNGRLRSLLSEKQKPENCRPCVMHEQHKERNAEDPAEHRADMLRGTMVMEPQRAVMLGQRAVPDAEEIANRARDVSQIFLNGCQLLKPSLAL
jgi:hypothetical protein